MGALKLYVEPHELRHMGATVAALAKRVGVGLASSIEGAVPMPLTDRKAEHFANSYPHQFMPSLALRRVTDRIDAQQLNAPTYFASLNPHEIDGPVFVKQRRTYKQYNPLGYTAWSSSNAFLDAHKEEFLQFQKNPDVHGGELIFQHLWKYPTKDFEVNFSVNQNSEVFFFLCGFRESFGIAQVHRTTTADIPEQIKNDVQRICIDEQIRGGFHCIEWTLQDNEWQIFDWNPRPAHFLTTHHFLDLGLADDALAHMCGLKTGAHPLVFFEQRGYYAKPISAKWFSYILSLGLSPRAERRGITRVTATAENPDVLVKRFIEMETTCVN